MTSVQKLISLLVLVFLLLAAGAGLGAWLAAGHYRPLLDAAQAQAEARELAKTDYAAANRLLQERTGGDQCAATAAIIDQELGP